MLDHLAVATQLLVDLRHVEVPVLRYGYHEAVADRAQRGLVLDVELSKAPFACEVLREEDSEEAEHASRVLGETLDLVVGSRQTRGLHDLRGGGHSWDRDALGACVQVGELLLGHSCERHVAANAVDVDSPLVARAANVL